MNAQQARRRREAELARQAARRRDRRRRLAIATVLAAVVVAGIGGLAVSAAGRGRRGGRPAGRPADGPAPWGANTADLAERLQAIGVPPLSPVEATAVHIHPHLDLYVDGHKVPVPAGIGIDPAAGFAPLHTHDASGVIHVESPTVRTYTLGQLFAVWGAVHPQLPGRRLRRRRPAAAGVRQRPSLPGRPHHAAPGPPPGARGRLRHHRGAALTGPVGLPVPTWAVAGRRGGCGARAGGGSPGRRVRPGGRVPGRTP